MLRPDSRNQRGDPVRLIPLLGIEMPGNGLGNAGKYRVELRDGNRVVRLGTQYQPVVVQGTLIFREYQNIGIGGHSRHT